MTDVATPTPPPAPATAPAQRACPRCGSPLAPDQEWCLSCGTAVGTSIAPTPRWRGPVILVGAVLALFVAALVLALVELSGDPQPVAKAPATAATAPTATPSVPPGEGGAAAAPTTAPQPSATPTPTPMQGVSPDEGGSSSAPNAIPTPGSTAPNAGGVATWPAGKSAWTVILASTQSRAEAQKKAAAAGSGAGVLHSDDFSSLRKGYWVVFVSQYPDQKSAEAAATGRGGDAYARRVVPR